jgi:hypothetical protein
MAEEAGRDPGQLGLILKVYPTATASYADIADTIVQARDKAGVDHAFVDLMYLAKSVDHALEITSGVLELARGR